MFYRPILTVCILGFISVASSPADTVRNPKKAASKQEKALVEVCQEVCEAYFMKIEAGKEISNEPYGVWSRRWRDAELALYDKPAAQVASYKNHMERMKAWE